MTNQSKIIVGVTLIWQKVVAVSKHNSYNYIYRPKMAIFKFGRLMIIRQAAKLNKQPIILLNIWYNNNRDHYVYEKLWH